MERHRDPSKQLNTGSEDLGAGTDNSRPPTGDGAAISYSTPQDPRTLSLFPLESVAGDVHSDLGPYRPSSREKQATALKSTYNERVFRYFRDDTPADERTAPVARATTGAEGHYPERVAEGHTKAAAQELGLQSQLLGIPAPVDRDLPDPRTYDETGELAGESHQLTLICPRWGIVGECEAGHQYAKELICRREWCPGCGGDGGKAHVYRIASKLPKARQLETMGKFTIPFPPEVRAYYRDPVHLAAVGIALKRMFQRHGFDRGIRRFHFFGEDHPGSGLQGDGLPPFHPHLEAIVGSGFVSKSKLFAIKKSVGRILGVPLSRVVVHYQYSNVVQKKLHMLRYMLRPTFEHYEWDQPLAYALVGFKNAVTWGYWHHQVRDPETGRMVNGDLLDPVWDVPRSESKIPEALAMGCCPLDGSIITWGGAIAAKMLATPWWDDSGGGYWAFTGEGKCLP